MAFTYLRFCMCFNFDHVAFLASGKLTTLDAQRLTFPCNSTLRDNN